MKRGGFSFSQEWRVFFGEVYVPHVHVHSHMPRCDFVYMLLIQFWCGITCLYLEFLIYNSFPKKKNKKKIKYQRPASSDNNNLKASNEPGQLPSLSAHPFQPGTLVVIRNNLILKLTHNWLHKRKTRLTTLRLHNLLCCCSSEKPRILAWSGIFGKVSLSTLRIIHTSSSDDNVMK